jgi:pectin methylesterase-like acyl-CoA thioesterase
MSMPSLSLRPRLGVPLLLAIACSDAGVDPQGMSSGGGNAGAAASAGTTEPGTGGRGGTSSAGSSGSGRGGNHPTGGLSSGSAGELMTGGQASGAPSGGVSSTAGVPNAGSAATETGGTGPAAGGTGPAAGGTAGNANSAGAAGDGGQEPLPPGVVALFPPPSAASVCPDPQLRITFAAPPTLGTSGQVRVVDADGDTVASVNMANANVTETLGGQSFSLSRRAFVEGNTAVIYLPARALAYGETYSVTLDAGTIVAPDAAPFSITAADAWRFSTAAGPPSDLGAIHVAPAGGGDFCSVQGALDAVPNANTTPIRITLAAGTYHELVYGNGKNHVTLRGADRKATRIVETNNENRNGGTKKRALVGFDGASDLVIENLTIHNLTPQGGSQAEALRLQNCSRCVVRDADLLSLQDTLLFSGQVYLKNCYVEGNVDFVWGTGTAYFDECEIKTVGRQGVVVQARNGNSGYGYVFVDSRITSDPGLGNSTLARIDVSAYPASHVAYIDCTLGSHITAAGWTITGGTPGTQLRFWEYRSRDLSGNLIDTSRRSAGSKQLSEAEAAGMRDKASVLGGWTPPD